MPAPLRRPIHHSWRCLAAAAALALAGCNAVTNPLTTGSLGIAPQSGSQPGEAGRLADAYRRNPADPAAALAYGHALREGGQRAQALAVLEGAAAKNPASMPLLGEYGRALAENGKLDQALEVLGHAHTPDQPDWHVLMAQGAVLDQLGRSTEALGYYRTALGIVPDEPSVLTDMGLSYALAGDLPQAEATLRRACASPGADARMRQNLALVVALQGRFAEAQGIAGHDLAPAEAARNIAALRGMLGQTNSWQRLRQMDGGKAPAPAAMVPPATVPAAQPG